ncbi:MAG TPA: non-homologous end-joining DNA ligase [Pirellulales bacterium]|jgi:bifunctional non-homologous end joining protein LigD
MGLTEYRRKRDFRVTGEPRGKTAASRENLSFVIQKHDASHLHYDFRLELDGVLKSWAVPKGPSLDPATKRLAMQVEDHPREYGSFEGIIPQGEYGGGTVLLWDQGTWEAVGDARKGYRDGALKFVLKGHKLHGGWMLVRKGGRRSTADERHWFLFKEQDRYAKPALDITAKKPLSIATGRDLEQIAAQSDRVWGPRGAVAQNGRTMRTRAGARREAATSRNHARATATAMKSRKKPKSPPHTKASSATSVVAGVTLSHPDKILYPEVGITKLDLAEYYEQAAPWMLPHVQNRLLSLVRCPAGSGQKCFFQKHPGEGTSEYLRRFQVKEKRTTEDYLALYDLAGLVSLVQMGALEIHLWGSQADHFEKPDRLIFDLDPDPTVAWPQVVTAAREVRLLLEELGLLSFVKTTGGKGLHIVVPIRRRTTWADAKAFCRSVADFLVAAAPDRYIAKMSKAARKGKIFVDYLRNDRGATAIAPYSTRASATAPVSVPLEWEELSPKITSSYFRVKNMPARFAKLKQDPWAEILSTNQSITASMIRKLRIH